MRAERPVNYDAKIKRLVAELRAALVARESARIEGAVASHIDGLVASLQVGVHLGGAPQAVTAAPAAAAASPRATAAAKPTGRRRRSPASSQAQAARMEV